RGEHRQRRVVRVGVLDRLLAEPRLPALPPEQGLRALPPKAPPRGVQPRHQSRGWVLPHQSDGLVLSSQATRSLAGRRTDGPLPGGPVFAVGALSAVAVAAHLWFWQRRRSQRVVGAGTG